MTEWQSGFSAGVAATIVGFALTMVWDGYKYRRDTLRREEAVLRGIAHELRENRELALENREIIQHDMEALKKRATLVRPLLILKSGFWDYLKFNIPTKLLADVELLEKLKNVALLAEHINEGIRSRQNYKDTSGSMDNFTDSIRGKNDVLDSNLARLNREIDDALSCLDAI